MDEWASRARISNCWPRAASTPSSTAPASTPDIQMRYHARIADAHTLLFQDQKHTYRHRVAASFKLKQPGFAVLQPKVRRMAGLFTDQNFTGAGLRGPAGRGA